MDVIGQHLDLLDADCSTFGTLNRENCAKRPSEVRLMFSVESANRIL